MVMKSQAYLVIFKSTQTSHVMDYRNRRHKDDFENTGATGNNLDRQLTPVIVERTQTPMIK